MSDKKDDKKDEKKDDKKEAPKHVPITTRFVVWSARLLFAALQHRAGIGAVFVAGLIGAGYGVWQYVDPHIMTDPGRQISPAEITLTPKPDWIRSDIKIEVLRDASLEDKLHVLDPELPKRLADAFALHPWVARVVQVRKGPPAWVDVQVVYRRPVCMVEVPGGLYAIDAEAVLLPSSDFSPADTRRYPRLGGIPVVTEGPQGTVWHDERVLGAARLAEVLVDSWAELQLLRIVPWTEQGRGISTKESAYELHTRGGSRIIWGHSPRVTTAAEPTAEEKLAKLRSFSAQRGGLDQGPGPYEIDLRRPGAPTAGPRTAAVSLDEGQQAMRPPKLR